MFEILKQNEIVEKGNWHFEIRGDYLIVYMNNEKDQLGYGRF